MSPSCGARPIGRPGMGYKLAPQGRDHHGQSHSEKEVLPTFRVCMDSLLSGTTDREPEAEAYLATGSVSGHCPELEGRSRSPSGVEAPLSEAAAAQTQRGHCEDNVDVLQAEAFETPPPQFKVGCSRNVGGQFSRIQRRTRCSSMA